MGLFTHTFDRKKRSTTKTSSPKNKFERSNDYRKKYLANHKGFFGIYCCAYCGKLCSKKNMQVDHIYPVNGVKGNSLKGSSGKLFITLISLFHGPTALKDGVNADWNKTAACPKCNGEKTDSMGLWILRGYLGKLLFPIMNFAMAGGLCYGVLNALISGVATPLYKVIFITVLIKTLLYLATGRKKKNKK